MGLVCILSADNLLDQELLFSESDFFEYSHKRVGLYFIHDPCCGIACKSEY